MQLVKYAGRTICSSLSPKSNPKSVYSLLRSVAGSSFSSSSPPNVPNCSSPRESATVYAAYLRSHFSVSQTKTLHSRARDHISELRRATTCPAPLLYCWSSCGCLPPLLIHCHKPRQSCLCHASSSLWHGFSSSHFQSFLNFAFLSFHLEDIFYYYHPQDGKVSRLSSFLPAYFSHLLCNKAFSTHRTISPTPLSGV